MLPSFLFMATAGEIVDKYPKDLIIKILKIFQVFTAILACIGFAVKNIWLLLVSLFLMGTAAAFLSTAKYSILPDILPKKNLLVANSLMQMTVLAAILSGTIFGGIIFSFPEYVLYVILIVTSLFGLFFAFIIPSQTACAPETIVHKNLISALWKNTLIAIKNRKIITNMLAISWFWFVGTIIISQIPTFVKYVLNGNNALFTFFIVILSVGVSIGTICCQILLNDKISDRLLVSCLSVIVLTLTDLSYVSSHYIASQDTITLRAFLSNLNGIRIMAILQISAPNHLRARIIAANNIINALFMILGSGFCALLLMLKTSIPAIFIISALLNLAVTILLYCVKKHHVP